MKREPKKKRVITPEERKRRNRRFNVIMMVMAVGWGVILVYTREQVFIRWFAALVLFLVGLTGFLGIGTERTRKPKQ
ncbi:MAG: hypothetical protein ABFC79_02455 [Candidatus Cryosericum sp.]|nr:hypothetical protein [Candidatus Cryosericum sp.]HPS69209.1 hypothetical protein [Candidatus Cryosericum sp.]